MYPMSMRDEMNDLAGQRHSTGVEQSQSILRQAERESGRLFRQA